MIGLCVDWVSVKTIADNAFSALNADGVAARNILMLNNNFTSNHKRQPFDIVKKPTVFGIVIEINTTDLTEHHNLPRINSVTNSETYKSGSKTAVSTHVAF